MNTDTARIVTDFNGLAALRAQARSDGGEAIDEVAQQFESLFIQMMLKSMRSAGDSGFEGGLFDNSQSRMFRDMSDQQMAVDLAGAGGIGLAEVIRRQLGGDAAPADAGMGIDAYRQRPMIAIDRAARPLVALGDGAADKADPVAAARPAKGAEIGRDTRQFLDTLWPEAEQAAARLGLPTEALLAQAALETGWGRHVMTDGNGRSSHNLFGIKADGRWDGERVRVTTLEYRDGVAMKTRADFRAYGGFAESFADYADFLQQPRYRQALQNVADPAAYFRALQSAGYATDPAYADKITAILARPEMAEARAAWDAVPARLAGRPSLSGEG